MAFDRCRRPLSAALLLLSFLFAAAIDARSEVLHGQGLLWKVRGVDGASPSYVFGTIHSDEPAVLDLPAHVERAIARADRFAFELDFERNVDAQMSRAMIDRSPPTLREQLTADEWETARRAATRRGLPKQVLSVLEPWALAITLAMPPSDPARSLDRMLFARAQERGAPITGLETAEEQITLFDSMPEDDQLALLRGVLDLAEKKALAPMFDRIIDAWLRGDVAAIMRISEANPMLPDASANDAFMDRLVGQRNRRMVERMQPLIERGGAFVAVGALHLPGEDGVLHLLEEQGYTVTRVQQQE